MIAALAIDPTKPIKIVKTFQSPAQLGRCGHYSAVIKYHRQHRRQQVAFEVRRHNGTHDVIEASFTAGTYESRREKACEERDRLACIEVAKMARLVR